MPDFDTLLVGGGLQNGLIALAVLRRRPDARIAVIERQARPGGNHTWCFHAGDVPRDLAPVIDPLVAYRWAGYRVRFPGLERTVTEPYCGTTSERLADRLEEALRAAPGASLLAGAEAVRVGPHRVELASGESLSADLVIDARGPGRFAAGDERGYQKFVGFELALAAPHQLELPTLIDATVAQRGGFRFMYLLPLAPDRVLVEDTTFGRDPHLDEAALEKSCLDYAAAAGLEVERVVRRERGALPMPWSGQAAPPSRPLVAGYQGGWFHPATGYSFPVALRLADFVSRRAPRQVVGPELEALWRRQMSQVRYCHRLNKMLFLWFAEGDEWNVFERFYRLPIDLIRRFYALDLNAADRLRIVVGRPPRGFSLRARLGRLAPLAPLAPRRDA